MPKVSTFPIAKIIILPKSCKNYLNIWQALLNDIVKIVLVSSLKSWAHFAQDIQCFVQGSPKSFEFAHIFTKYLQIIMKSIKSNLVKV